MTEEKLRDRYVTIADSYYGVVEGSRDHHEIVDIYNSHIPLARGYRLRYTDSWCAGFVSAMAIKCGITDIIPTEVGTDAMIALFQKNGDWVENDAYIPKPGDIIFFDWDDDGVGDNQEATSHVGIVEGVFDGQIRTIEGNMNNRVGSRLIPVNGRYIRGFGTPDYASYDSQETEERIMYHTVNDCPEWARPTIQKLVDKGFLSGDENGDLQLTHSMVRIFVIHDRAGMYD